MRWLECCADVNVQVVLLFAMPRAEQRGHPRQVRPRRHPRLRLLRPGPRGLAQELALGGSPRGKDDRAGQRGRRVEQPGHLRAGGWSSAADQPREYHQVLRLLRGRALPVRRHGALQGRRGLRKDCGDEKIQREERCHDRPADAQGCRLHPQDQHRAQRYQGREFHACRPVNHLHREDDRLRYGLQVREQTGPERALRLAALPGAGAHRPEVQPHGRRLGIWRAALPAALWPLPV
mmetsp:Transcript_48661/g.139055  ORF Transcript_48661/g.139055 Transcript_48661/m.139055 type:complete len:235 (-) Transcript_48661:922-1626(-)